MSNVSTIVNLDESTIYVDVRTDVESVIKHLLLTCPLFGDILINVSRSVTLDKKVTAYVTPKLNMVIGIQFWNTLSFDNKVFVLVHECLHLINNHFIRFSYIFESICKESNDVVEAIKNSIKMKQLNIALDTAINQINPYGKIIDGGFDLAKFNLYMSQPAKPNMCSEYYWQHMQKYMNKFDNIDDEDHINSFYDLSESDITKIRDVVEKAKLRQKEFEKNSGHNPGEMEEKILIDKSVNTDEKLWKCFINRFAGNIYIDFEYQYGKASRRDKDAKFGKNKIYESGHKIAILDTSGSVDSLSLNKFISHFNAALKKYDVTLDIIQCDAGLNITKNVSSIPSVYSVVGRGGTDLTKALEYIANNYKGQKDIIVLTDGETPWWTEGQIKENLMDIVALYTSQHSKLSGVKYHINL